MDKIKTIALLSRVKNSEAEIKFCHNEIESIRGSETEQESFFNYCLKWKMAPWIYLQLIKHGLLEIFEKRIQVKFSAIHQKIKKENESRNSISVLFLKAFFENGIDVIVLKGNLFSQTFYGDTGYKKMNDFDILVHPEDWPKIQEIYFKLGFIPMGFGWSGEKQKPAKFSHTGIPFMSADFKCIIGTQWGLKSPTTSFKVNMNDAWEKSLPFDFYGIPCRQLSPEYNLLHLILHMGIYKCGIRDCMDVYNLIDSHSWNKENFIQLLVETNAIEKAAFTFEMCKACGIELKENWMLDLPVNNSSFIGKRIQKRKLMVEETGDLHTSYNDYFQDIEKNVIYFNLFYLFHQRIVFYGKILRLIYFPSTAHTLKFIDRAHRPTLLNKLKGRLQGPWFSFSMIAQEIGWKITIVLFMKLFVDVLISPINYLIRRDSYFDYLKKRGIDPKQIKKVVNNVQ